MNIRISQGQWVVIALACVILLAVLAAFLIPAKIVSFEGPCPVWAQPIVLETECEVGLHKDEKLPETIYLAGWDAAKVTISHRAAVTSLHNVKLLTEGGRIVETDNEILHGTYIVRTRGQNPWIEFDKVQRGLETTRIIVEYIRAPMALE